MRNELFIVVLVACGAGSGCDEEGWGASGEVRLAEDAEAPEEGFLHTVAVAVDADEFDVTTWQPAPVHGELALSLGELPRWSLQTCDLQASSLDRLTLRLAEECPHEATPDASCDVGMGKVDHALLVQRGVVLAARTGLGSVLGWQHAEHGDVYGLVAGVRRLSPAMALGSISRGSLA